MIPGDRRPRLVAARRKCLTFYFYFLDSKLGLLHVRLQSWFPLVMQICVNGHEILARKLDKHGIGYRKQGNAFTWIEDPPRGERQAARMRVPAWTALRCACIATPR